MDRGSEKRKKTKNKKALSLKVANKLKLGAVILVILLLTAIAAAQFGGVTLSTVADYVATAIARIGAGEGYPYHIGSTVHDTAITNSDLVLLYDDSVKVLNSTAKEISNLNHSYDHPIISTNSGRILLYDIGGKKFRVQSKTRVLYEKELDRIILTGAIGRDGSVVIASRADNAESMLTVFDKQRKEAFVWKCASEHIISCDISDNGKNFAVAVIGVENGSVYSKIHIFNIKKTEPIASFEYNSSTITSVQFLSNETLMVMGNNVCQIINDGQVVNNIDVSVNTPSKLYISDNNTAILVLSKYSSTTQKIIKVYNKAGEEIFTSEISGLVKAVSTDGKYIAILTDSNVQIYNTKGEMTGYSVVNADAENVLVTARNTYVYSSDRIDRYSSIEILK